MTSSASAVELALMDVESLRVFGIAMLIAGASVWVLSTLFFRVTGTWERDLSDAERTAGSARERIVLGQLGPFVTGRRDVEGGYQQLSGIMIGRRLFLTRRDFGTPSLLAMGFPEGIAHRLEGEVMARLRLTLVDGVVLEGSFEPQKVEFTHQPPRVTGMYFLEKRHRRYRRVEPAPAVAPAPSEA